jgi:uncharacterized NAD(P)/FAD-binding protein YdhS
VIPAAGSFVPRCLFGTYVRHLLRSEMRRPDRQNELVLLPGDVVGIDRGNPRLVLQRDRAPPIEADLAVLAVGNFPPEPMPVGDPSFYDSALYRPDPWAQDAFTALDPAAPVLLVGTGLTMVDAVVSLLDQGHHGPIYALSRRGLLPRRHPPGAPPPDAAHAYPTGLVELTRFLRREVAGAAAQGGDWRPAIDALRPFTQDVWQAMSLSDRARFLRHLRPWWDVHRHRMPGPVADRIDGAIARRQLRIRAGRIRGFRVEDGMIDVIYQPRGVEVITTLLAARVINCAGPCADYDRIADPLVRRLLAEGTARPDTLRLGLDVTGTCALRLGSGAVSRRLFAVGPVTKAAFWEMTAVPDIRRQCELLAQHLATLVKAPGGVTPVRRRNNLRWPRWFDGGCTFPCRCRAADPMRRGGRRHCHTPQDKHRGETTFAPSPWGRASCRVAPKLLCAGTPPPPPALKGRGRMLSAVFRWKETAARTAV